MSKQTELFEWDESPSNGISFFDDGTLTFETQTELDYQVIQMDSGSVKELYEAMKKHFED